MACHRCSKYAKDPRTGIRFDLILIKFDFHFQEILADAHIIKVGTDPHRDAQYLCEDYDVYVKSTLDLRYMAREAGCHNGRGGLTAMSENFVGISLDRDWEMRALNWNNPTLAADKIDYASKKTRADMELFKFFMEKILAGQRFRDNAQKLKHVIDNHCSRYLNCEYR